MQPRLSFEVFPTVAFEPCDWFEIALRSRQSRTRAAFEELMTVAEALVSCIPPSVPHRLQLTNLRYEVGTSTAGRLQVVRAMSMVVTELQPFTSREDQPILSALLQRLGELGVVEASASLAGCARMVRRECGGGSETIT